MSAEDQVPAWHHAPTHELTEDGARLVSCSTFGKSHHFRTNKRLKLVTRGIFALTREFGWDLQAWAVFSNHYHFVARPPSGDAKSLSTMLSKLHTITAAWIN